MKTHPNTTAWLKLVDLDGDRDAIIVARATTGRSGGRDRPHCRTRRVCTINVDRFVPRDEINDLYINRPYYIVPDGEVGLQAFGVIREGVLSIFIHRGGWESYPVPHPNTAARPARWRGGLAAAGIGAVELGRRGGSGAARPSGSSAWWQLGLVAARSGGGSGCPAAGVGLAASR
jgi:hypothetical protein